TMQREYGTEAEHLLACIGPGICMDCYEVGDELYQAFQSSFDPCSLGDIFVKKSNTKYHLNLMEANKRILLQLGVLEENIHVFDICTHCNSDYLFSHRKHGENRGNLAAFLALR
ncbi:laccase domain-containing protein, partial [Bacteroides heparinolyticus]|uniref:laccase domain-containing protein n=1 Tax=Prevotella heparinolytica TaxID=28113 RepID=UPI00359F4C0D